MCPCAGGTYLSIEFCTAPRPSPSLKGDAARYLAAFVALRRHVASVLGGAVAVLPNPGATETCPWPADYLPPLVPLAPLAPLARAPPLGYTSALESERYPRLGSCEVVARSQLGGFCCLHSKVGHAPVATHYSLLTTHYSLLTTCYSLLTTCHSLLTH